MSQVQRFLSDSHQLAVPVVQVAQMESQWPLVGFTASASRGERSTVCGDGR